jgi:hypothetical protein
MAFALLVVSMSASAFFTDVTCCDIDEKTLMGRPGWKETLVGSSRKDVLDHFRAEERTATAARKNVSEPPAPPPDLPDRRQHRVQETKAEKLTRFSSDAYVLNALVGNISIAGGAVLPHGVCKHPLGIGPFGTLACHHQLWTHGEPELRAHICRQVNMTQEARSQWSYERMRDKYYPDPPSPSPAHPSAPPTNSRWHWMVNGREVCQRTWCAVNCVGESTINSFLPRILNDREFAHAKREEGSSRGPVAAISDFKALAVIAWYQVYAEDVGDYMPEPEGPGELVIPLRPLTEEWKEYNDGRVVDLVVSYPYFCEVVRGAAELDHIRHARPCYNFQKCTSCVNNNSALASAIKTHDPAKIASCQAIRTSHHKTQKGERLCYYRSTLILSCTSPLASSLALDSHTTHTTSASTRTLRTLQVPLHTPHATSAFATPHKCVCVPRNRRRELGADPHDDSCSIILDKWDSAKSTCPYFARSPGAWWSSTKHDVLQQHVLGVLVHNKPQHYVFLYPFNDSIKGDANVNIEGIRRTLASLYSDTAMPRTLYVQADNASDNKNWTLILFFAMLIYHDYTIEVFFSFLLVGHTVCNAATAALCSIQYDECRSPAWHIH